MTLRNILPRARRHKRVLLEITGELMQNAADVEKTQSERKDSKAFHKTILIECVYVLVRLDASHLLLYWSLKYSIETLRALVSYE